MLFSTFAESCGFGRTIIDLRILVSYIVAKVESISWRSKLGNHITGQYLVKSANCPMKCWILSIVRQHLKLVGMVKSVQLTRRSQLILPLKRILWVPTVQCITVRSSSSRDEKPIDKLFMMAIWHRMVL